MNDTTPRELIAEVTARADAATPGPWRLDKPRSDGRNCVARDGYGLFGEEVSEWIIFDTNPSDAEFIAHARTDVPVLAAALSVALNDNDRLRGIIADEVTWWQDMREDHAEHLMILRDASLARLAKAVQW